jgi:predicted transcriptional regulator
MTEKEAFVMFPRIKGQVDIEEAFYSNNKDFHTWCQEYFEYCWCDTEQFRTGDN